MAADLERGRYVVVVLFLCWSMILGLRSIAAERPLGSSTAQAGSNGSDRMDGDKPPLLGRLVNSLSKKGSHSHAWPELELGWRVVLGSTIGFAGSALGSVGGVGGGGIFVPMLTLILGFDLKTSAAISKCKERIRIALSAILITVPRRLLANGFHQVWLIDLNGTVDESLPSRLVFLGMIMGAAGATVYYNLRFRHHTLDMPIIDFDLALLFQPMLLLGISIGIAFNVIFAEWMITTILIVLFLDGPELEYRPLPGVQIENEKPTTSSNGGVPIAASLTLYEAICLYKGKKTIASTGKQEMNWRCHHLVFCCCCGIIAGIIGGLLGLGGGFILGPLFIEMGAPPQVASATSNFVMTFSSSMSVIQLPTWSISCSIFHVPVLCGHTCSCSWTVPCKEAYHFDRKSIFDHFHSGVDHLCQRNRYRLARRRRRSGEDCKERAYGF
ncbi:hypothetical protein ZIOFF_073842 [Zingiber officinale]|uniref:Sulfite exporter TauE/SafE family protein n=1 Tax=Zingiber officinale TaxID=94328 RepID=A0A8J5CTN2_ZINOF|nr:hypothetical protein ZIOFF_073842 [Zingiber officinale]